MNRIRRTTMDEQREKSFGKTAATENANATHFSRLRKTYLQTQRPVLYNELLMNGTLEEHLAEVDEAAQSRMQTIMDGLSRKAGINEEMKATDQMKWVGLMNACKAQAEEIVLNELIYS